MSQFIVPAIQGANSKAKIVSYNGTPFVLDMMRDGDIVEMDVGKSLGWVGMAGIDADMRVLCGKGTVTKLNTPAYIFDKSNVATAGKPATFNDGYGDAHIAGFKKLWGLGVTTSPAAASAAGASSGEALLVERLSKRFGGALALDNVDLTVRRGEVHGLARQQWVGQIDADQDPCRFPCPGARRAHRAVRAAACRCRYARKRRRRSALPSYIRISP